MAVLRTAHHGAHISTIKGAATALRPAGFTHTAVGGVTEFRPDERDVRAVVRKIVGYDPL